VLPIVLTEAVGVADFVAAGTLFREYAAGLGVDLCFQGFEAELASLPEMYGAPEGCLLLARAAEQLAGCGALRRLAGEACQPPGEVCQPPGEVCEMKRLYVRAEARGTGLGRILAESLIAKAQSLGYSRMRLDTLAHMTAARRLYRSLGFVERAAYYDNPLPNVVYMELDLLA
jgi:ribosomal protein S18 acetylase RimI-like enzyme